MQKKQYFKLNEEFYMAEFCDLSGYACFVKDTVCGIKLRGEIVYIEGTHTNFIEQELCGHTLEEAKEIAIRNLALSYEEKSKCIRALKEEN